jgi:hypothetical protein
LCDTRAADGCPFRGSRHRRGFLTPSADSPKRVRIRGGDSSRGVGPTFRVRRSVSRSCLCGRCRPPCIVAARSGVCCIPLGLCPLLAGPSGLVRRSVAPCGHSNEQPERPSWSCLHLQSALWRPGLATPQVRLSWDSSGVPCVRLTRPCPLPSRVAATLRPTGFPPDGAFRSRGFSPPQRFAPSAELWACCIPVPDRVRVVSASVRAPRSDPVGQSCVVRCRASPTRRSHPSKKSPLSQPFRVTAAVALLALRLPVNRAETRLAERPSPSGRCSAPGSVVPSAVSGGRHPLLPWAWFPFRALKPTPRCRVARPPSRPVSACSTTQPPPERPNRFPDSAALVIPGALPPIAASCHARRAPVCPAVSVPPRLTAPPDESGCAVRGGRTLLGFVTSKNESTVCRALRPVRRTHSISRSALHMHPA